MRNHDNTSRIHSENLRAMNAAVLGQQTVVERLLIALLANGNVLMEGLPGTAKTRSIKTLSGLIDSQFRRVQFTPDLLPSDVTGSEIYREQTATFEFQPGPLFGNLVLADEINRAPAKVQAALLEAMEERQVTVAGKTHKLPDLFLVLATQNPIEQEGTYPLPEAQMDRFLVYVRVPYPPAENELSILRLVRSERAGSNEQPPEPVSQEVDLRGPPGSGGGACRRIGRALPRRSGHRFAGTKAIWRRPREMDPLGSQSPSHDCVGCRRAGTRLAARQRFCFPGRHSSGRAGLFGPSHPPVVRSRSRRQDSRGCGGCDFGTCCRQLTS